MHFGYLEITPELANQILEKSEIRNRVVCQNVVNRYAEDMKNGKWDTKNSATLAFDKKGNLIDGQHRLHALIQAGVTLTFACFRDCSDEAFKTIDIGRNRSLGDILYLDKIVDYNTQRASTYLSKLYMIHYYNTVNAYDFAGRKIKSNIKAYEKLKGFITPLASVDIDGVSRKCYSYKKRSQNILGETQCAIIFLAYMRQYATIKDKNCLIYIEKLESFFESICSNFTLQIGQQGLAYIKTVSKINTKAKNDKQSSLFRYIALVNAWNNHIKNKCQKNLSYTTEKYLPKIYGYEYDYVEE